MSELTIDTSVKKCHVESSKPSVVKKKRKKGVLINILVKKLKENYQQMIQAIIICVKPAMWKKNIKTKRLKILQISYQVRNFIMFIVTSIL